MRLRHVKPAVFLAWTALACGAWGCTFLIGFDEQADGGGGVVDTPDTSVSRRDATTSADTGSTPLADAGPDVLAEPACDTAFPLSQVGGCNNFTNNGQICAKNAKFTYPAGYSKTNDLITCSNTGGVAKAACVRHCLGSGGCASLPEGFPDQCDTCQGRANGTYCGSDLGFTKEDGPLLVTCTSNKLSTVKNCDAGCTAKTDTTAACK